MSTTRTLLLLHHLRTTTLCRIAHNLRLIDRRLRIITTIRIDSAIRGALSTSLDQLMSLFVQSAFCKIHGYTKLSTASNYWKLESDKERTFNASLREKLLSQCPHGNGFTARWIRLWRFRSWLRLKDCGHWSHLNGRSFWGCG